jgi:hypothetical protein
VQRHHVRAMLRLVRPYWPHVIALVGALLVLLMSLSGAGSTSPMSLFVPIAIIAGIAGAVLGSLGSILALEAPSELRLRVMVAGTGALVAAFAGSEASVTATLGALAGIEAALVVYLLSRRAMSALLDSDG